MGSVKKLIKKSKKCEETKTLNAAHVRKLKNMFF
jgi:hypothetical protein